MEDAVDELAQTTEKGFHHNEKRFNRIEEKMATKQDLEKLATKEDLARGEKKTDNLEVKVDRLERGVKALLDASNETNQMLREQQKIPDRVSRLERTVF